MDFDAAGLLDGLTGAEREARKRLLERLSADGATIDELKAAVHEERLALLPVERALGGSHTAREVEQLTGLPAEQLVKVRRLQGLPQPELDEPAFGEEDIAAAKALKLFLDAGFDEERIMQITRVLGEAMARLAATATAAFADTFLEAGDSEEDVALRFTALTEQLTPALTPVLVAAFRAHLRESVRRGMLRAADRRRGRVEDAVEVAVCFADLVGFTSLGGELEARELGTLAGRLEELAGDVAKPPVRLVKTIGDAAMFVAREPGPLVEAALTLVEAVERAEMPALRAGVAWGSALQRTGDFYGQAVNLASRVTGIARPGSVLCTQEVRDAAADRFDWSFAGKHRLKGLPEPLPLHRARRLAEGEETRSESKAARKPRADRRRRSASSSRE